MGAGLGAGSLIRAPSRVVRPAAQYAGNSLAGLRWWGGGEDREAAPGGSQSRSRDDHRGIAATGGYALPANLQLVKEMGSRCVNSPVERWVEL